MADSKITALASIGTGTDPANDPLVIVDVSDILPGGMSLTGTTKKVTLNNLLACSPTATLASATITGDLTVDTSTLKVDSANNRVGIGTASPNNTLTVRGTQDAGIEVNSADSNSSRIITAYDPANTRFYINSTSSGSGTVLPLDFLIGNSAQYRIAASGVFTWYDGAGGTRMTLNSTGLGVGRSPSYRLQASSGTKATTASLATVAGITTTDADDFGIYFRLKTDATGANRYAAISSFDNGSGNGARDLVLQDLGGNVGIGVTPSAGKGCLQLSSGINFPATQVASSDANTLDDYEEGTWTPSVGGTATYTTQTGRYVKIGNRVFITFRMTINTIGTGDDYRISGLPFQPAAVLAAASVGFFANLKISANFISGYASTASSVITMTGTTAASANVTNGIGVFGNGSDIAMSCFYEV